MIFVLTPSAQYSAISLGEQVIFGWNNDDIRFEQCQHAELDFYSVSSLKQQPEGRHVTSCRHIMLILSQPVLGLT